MSNDQKTADAFADSWNHLPAGSVYTSAQFEDWMAPLTETDFRGKRVLELGCGNASLLVHACHWQPREAVGVDLGASVMSARRNVGATGHPNVRIEQGDLVTYRGEPFDIVYCIGVLHHLKHPERGFESVIANATPGGRFHCWVYAKEGNALVRLVVEPVRLVASRLPWWLTKYLLATPLVAPYYLYAKLLRYLDRRAGARTTSLLRKLPLYDYSLWIADREFAFFRHVAFDQLVTPQTLYISKQEVDAWLKSNPRIDQHSTYVIRRNGNSWKFGGRLH